MVIPDILGTIAEIVITIAALMGVIVVFNPSRSREMYYRIQWVFTVALIVLAALLAPHLLIGFSDSPAIVFGLPLGFPGAGYFCILGFGLWQQASGLTTKTVQTFFRVLFLCATAGIAVSLLLSSADVLVPRLPQMLILGAAWAIVIVTMGFVSSIRVGTDT